ncbi:hypothetical protein [Alcaligenes faecalis]|uniref:hypothetical protein n=1 Tax=Alcaligenes faecalis TaxID=511 RepID=UPI000F0B3EF7|nr:hypothetical protein [Alcaligenes faecalis]AYR21789.1 hypothetical protein D6I95_16440 [Alcaligenes faecalis]
MLREVKHPGVQRAQPYMLAACQTESHTQTLRAGHSLLDAFRLVGQAHDLYSAVGRFKGGQFVDLHYVMPALSSSPDHSVYYSQLYTHPGPVQIEQASVTLGRNREGKLWLHCHAAWRDAQGQLQAGHILPDQTILGGSPELDMTYVRGAAFETLPCPETNFSLFTPVVRPELSPAQAGSPQSWIVSLAPNQNISAVLRDICQELGLTRAVIRGGVGSLVGAILEPEFVVEPFVTEVLIEEGRIDLSLPADQQVQLDVIIIDYQHGVHRGRLKPEVNSVLVTFELVLEAA